MRAKELYFVDNFFPVISEATKQSVAERIRMSPSGEKDRPVVKRSLPIIIPIPKNPRIPPKISLNVKLSFRKNLAARRVKIGIAAPIIPALRALVNRIPKKKNEILSVTAKSPASIMRGISFFSNFNLFFTKGKRIRDATVKRTRASEKTGTVSRAIFITELFSPQILEAMIRAKKGSR